MGENSNIEWTDHTFNPWIGCTKVSPGCAHCYAERDMARYGKAKWGAGQPRVRTAASTWRQPITWDRKAAAAGQRERVFCASLADVFDPEVPVAWLSDLFDLISATPNLDWLLLTKRPQLIMERIGKVFELHMDGGGRGPDLVSCWIGGMAPRNVWLGTTVEDQQRADERIPALLAVPARVRFLSCEPLLGTVDLELEKPDNGAPIGIDWIIAGGESGPHARPMHPEWARSLRDQAQAAGVPFLFKQWGEWAPWCNPNHFTHSGEERHPHVWRMPDGRYGLCWIVDDDGSWSNWTGNPPEGCQVMGRHGKGLAGRMLDNRTWDEVPSP